MSVIEINLVFGKDIDINNRDNSFAFTIGSKIEIDGDAKYQLSKVDIKYDDDKTDSPALETDKYSWDVPSKNEAETIVITTSNEK